MIPSLRKKWTWEGTAIPVATVVLLVGVGVVTAACDGSDAISPPDAEGFQTPADVEAFFLSEGMPPFIAKALSEALTLEENEKLLIGPKGRFAGEEHVLRRISLPEGREAVIIQEAAVDSAGRPGKWEDGSGNGIRY